MGIALSDVEGRVLGCLVEKEITTPEYYPLSLNALLHACNQKSNRDPLMNLDEAAVRQALRGLSEQALARSAGGDSRVAKYEHRLAEVFNFTRPETAILCELLLRGPQTPGELRTRAERMHPFEDLNVVHTTLKHLMEREPPLVELLPRQPGMKEARYAHLLSSDREIQEREPRQPKAEISVSNNIAERDGVARLENEVAGLRQEVADLKRQFAEFRKQFE
ncbi:MAG: YceH family protein [Candidatus Acidiferrales bacterium]